MTVIHRKLSPQEFAEIHVNMVDDYLLEMQKLSSDSNGMQDWSEFTSKHENKAYLHHSNGLLYVAKLEPVLSMFFCKPVIEFGLFGESPTGALSMNMSFPRSARNYLSAIDPIKTLLALAIKANELNIIVIFNVNGSDTKKRVLKIIDKTLSEVNIKRLSFDDYFSKGHKQLLSRYQDYHILSLLGSHVRKVEKLKRQEVSDFTTVKRSTFKYVFSVSEFSRACANNNIVVTTSDKVSMRENFANLTESCDFKSKAPKGISFSRKRFQSLISEVNASMHEWPFCDINSKSAKSSEERMKAINGLLAKISEYKSTRDKYAPGSDKYITHQALIEQAQSALYKKSAMKGCKHFTAADWYMLKSVIPTRILVAIHKMSGEKTIPASLK